MPQFDFLDNLKNTLTEQFAPQQGAVGGALPPDFGQPPVAPDLGIPQQGPSSLEQFNPDQGLAGGDLGGIPQAQGGLPAPEAAQVPPLGAITLKDLLGMGLDALLIGLLTSQSPATGLGGGLPPEQPIEGGVGGSVNAPQIG